MKKVLITGANRGIGLGLVKQLLLAEDMVFATCREPSLADELQTLSKEYPDHLVVVQLDVGCDESVAAAFATVSGRTNHLDILINNAGINFQQGFEQFKAADMLQTFNINTVGVMRVATAFVDLLGGGEQSKLINMSSQLGSLTNPLVGWEHYGYNGSKAAINMLTRYLALDLAADEIVVVSIHPGWVQTDMGGPEAPVTLYDSVTGILNVVQRVTLKDSGKFLAFTGVEQPW